MKLDKDYRKIGNWKYELLEPMSCTVELPHHITSAFFDVIDSVLTVKTHYAWDGASGPTFDDKTNMRASLFHDALCQMVSAGVLEKKHRKYADELFYKHLLEDGMAKWRAWCYFKAVRAYSKCKGM